MRSKAAPGIQRFLPTTRKKKVKDTTCAYLFEIGFAQYDARIFYRGTSCEAFCEKIRAAKCSTPESFFPVNYFLEKIIPEKIIPEKIIPLPLYPYVFIPYTPYRVPLRGIGILPRIFYRILPRKNTTPIPLRGEAFRGTGRSFSGY